jgi:NADH dehydrogenase [ubiquinone] 1 alpha subcomplex assembly factor 1
MQIYTENWVNSPGQMEDNSWQAFVFVPKDNWYIARVGPSFSCLFAKA